MRDLDNRIRHVILTVLVGSVSLFVACSYITDFAVVNESDQPIEVWYKVKNYPGPFAPPVTPATIAATQLSSKGSQQWTTLTSEQYQLHQESRTVQVRVMPHQALLIANMHNYIGHEDAWGANEFPIEEITIRGGQGEIKLADQKARTTFSQVSRALYILTYK